MTTTSTRSRSALPCASSSRTWYAVFLESALQKTFIDPAFRADMAKLKLDVSDHFVNGKELKALTSEIGRLTDAEIKEMEFVIERKYQKR